MLSRKVWLSHSTSTHSFLAAPLNKCWRMENSAIWFRTDAKSEPNTIQINVTWKWAKRCCTQSRGFLRSPSSEKGGLRLVVRNYGREFWSFLKDAQRKGPIVRKVLWWQVWRYRTRIVLLFEAWPSHRTTRWWGIGFKSTASSARSCLSLCTVTQVSQWTRSKQFFVQEDPNFHLDYYSRFVTNGMQSFWALSVDVVSWSKIYGEFSPQAIIIDVCSFSFSCSTLHTMLTRFLQSFSKLFAMF